MTEVTSGWMTKVVPTWVGKSFRRYFILWDTNELQFFDREHNGTMLGKLNLKDATGFELKSQSGGRRSRGATVGPCGRLRPMQRVSP